MPWTCWILLMCAFSCFLLLNSFLFLFSCVGIPKDKHWRVQTTNTGFCDKSGYKAVSIRASSLYHFLKWKCWYHSSRHLLQVLHCSGECLNHPGDLFSSHRGWGPKPSSKGWGPSPLARGLNLRWGGRTLWWVELTSGEVAQPRVRKGAFPRP